MQVLLRIDTVGICGSDVKYWTVGSIGHHITLSFFRKQPFKKRSFMKKDYEIADHRLLLDMAIFWTEIDSPVTLFALSYNSPTMSA
jgi:hypothetical protein